MQEYAREQRLSGKRIAVVPTMGYLHEGHMSLIDVARKAADVVIVTIFVNPTQFGPNEDLDKYPRDFDRDRELCEARGAQAIFAPEADAMYCPDRSTWVNEEMLSRGLCGKSRPVHFRGVTTVVAKLFNATLPDVAVFGQKDAQQALIIKRMVRDLNFPVEIIVAPIVREPDGLAMSSRNRYLSEDERTRATALSKALFAARLRLEECGMPELPESVTDEIRMSIEAAGGKVDYIEMLDAETLEPVSVSTQQVLIAIAVFFGTTRLIDNVMITLEK